MRSLYSSTSCLGGRGSRLRPSPIDHRRTSCTAPHPKTTRVSPVWGMVPSWTPFIIFSASLWSCLQREISMKSWTVTTSRIYRGSIGCHRLWLETSGDSA
ncbi:unnamed protein product, partial [Sphacelaria rigidula]